MTKRKCGCEGCGYWFELRSGLMACHYALVNGHTRTAVLGGASGARAVRAFYWDTAADSAGGATN